MYPIQTSCFYRKYLKFKTVVKMPLIIILAGSSNTKCFTALNFDFLSSGKRGIRTQRRKDFQNKHISGMLVLNTANALLSLEQIQYNYHYCQGFQHNTFHAFHSSSNNSNTLYLSSILIQVHFRKKSMRKVKV